MLKAIVEKWWVVLLRGICAVLFGLIAIAWPSATVWSLVTVYGAFAFADGVICIALGISGLAEGRWWWEMVLIGLVGIAAGIMTFLWQGLPVVALLVVIASTTILRGAFEVAAAINLREFVENDWLLSGILSVGFGILLFFNPGAGSLAVVLLIGSYMIAVGIMAIALSVR
ncbi:MAG TPA: DUF308 domain-containing protein [Candidatus Binatia bacterium]|jgi:uncharacterized membrane protein HdeD (DUF308 family)